MQTADDEAILEQFKVRICFEFWILPEILWTTKNYTLKNLLCIGESPSKYPFLKNNGSEAPKGIHYFSGMDTNEDFLRLKIHHTLVPLFRYNKRF